jgi:hypothetical protein
MPSEKSFSTFYHDAIKIMASIVKDQIPTIKRRKKIDIWFERTSFIHVWVALEIPQNMNSGFTISIISRACGRSSRTVKLGYPPKRPHPKESHALSDQTKKIGLKTDSKYTTRARPYMGYGLPVPNRSRAKNLNLKTGFKYTTLVVGCPTLND